jgi:hypothetical protein
MPETIITFKGKSGAQAEATLHNQGDGYCQAEQQSDAEQKAAGVLLRPVSILDHYLAQSYRPRPQGNSTDR